MPDRLFVRYFPESDSLQWLMYDGEGNVKLRGEGPPEAFAERTAEMSWSGSVSALLPGETVLLTSADIPTRQRRQIQQAVPYMVEDDLATEVEQCHFAIGERLPDGEISVAAIERGTLDQILERLSAAGLAPGSMKLDTLCVPFDGTTSVLIEHGRVHVKTGPASGLSLETALAGTALGLLPEDAAVSVVTCADGGDAGEVLVAQLEAETDGAAQVDVSDAEGFDLLCANYGQSELDLLQGEYEVDEITADDSNGWSLVWKLGVAVFALQVLLFAGEGLYLGTLADQYDADARALYARTFPKDRNVRDVRARWQSHLSGGGGEGGGFLQVFGAAVRHLPGSSLDAQNVNFNESRGDLILQLEAPRSEQLVGFSQTLGDAGLTAEIGTINQAEDQVKGSIKVRLQ